ncbi:MAG: hypothetical protein LBS56_06835, partial [Propionibacteriaceae bacterium]|nr:hypothetical protein [Propionibacteriaceae bacterium]
MPYSLLVLLENQLRHLGESATDDDVAHVARWDAAAEPQWEVQFTPARVLMQDFTGVPCVVDLATMREALAQLGGDPAQVNPLAPTELVIDHSVVADFFGAPDAFERNRAVEYDRNGERYRFLRWGQGAFDNFRVVPPGTGICHQVNIEHLARVVVGEEPSLATPPTGPGAPGVLGPEASGVTGTRVPGVTGPGASGGIGPEAPGVPSPGAPPAYFDTCVGTDSHTTMVNGLGVLGWGVGGIEAEAALLGQPIPMLIPQVVGFKVKGDLNPGVTATDLLLTVAQRLRQHGVVGRFVEFHGPGVAALSVPTRCSIANMSPEYGSTAVFFPVDGRTVDYL